MRKQTTNACCCVIAILASFLLSGCNDSGNEKLAKVISEATKEAKDDASPPSVSDLENVFRAHKETMKEMVDLCVQNPTIRRVENEESGVIYYSETDLPDNDLLKPVVQSIKASLSAIGATSIVCGRRGDYDEKPLAVVSFAMYSSGLSVSGEAKNIVYRTEWSRDNSKTSGAESGDRGYTPIEGASGWYIYESQ